MMATSVVTEQDRFPPRDKADMTAEQRLMVSDIESRRGKMPAPYEVLAGSPDVAVQFERLSSRLWKGALPIHILEAVFLITARHYRCAYQWRTHRNKALEAGLTWDIVRAIGENGGLEEACSARQDVLDIHRFLQQLYTRHTVSDQCFDKLAAHFNEAELSEFLAFSGIAVSVAMLLNVRQIDPTPVGDTVFC